MPILGRMNMTKIERIAKRTTDSAPVLSAERPAMMTGHGLAMARRLGNGWLISPEFRATATRRQRRTCWGVVQHSHVRQPLIQQPAVSTRPLALTPLPRSDAVPVDQPLSDSRC